MTVQTHGKQILMQTKQFKAQHRIQRLLRAHVPALKATIAILILSIYLQVNPKASRAPYKIQSVQRDFSKSDFRIPGQKRRDVK